jgi:hypothetical protein
MVSGAVFYDERVRVSITGAVFYDERVRVSITGAVVFDSGGGFMTTAVFVQRIICDGWSRAGGSYMKKQRVTG